MRSSQVQVYNPKPNALVQNHIALRRLAWGSFDQHGCLRIRLRHRRRGLGRLRARQSPDANGRHRCCCSKPDRRTVRCGFTCRSVTARRCGIRSTTGAFTPSPIRHAPAQDLLAARARPGRIEFDQRPDLHPRPAARLRSLGRGSATRAGAGTMCCPYFIRSRGQPARGVPIARRRRAGRGVGHRRAARTGRSVHRRRRQLGVPRTDDFNDAPQEGVGYYQLTTSNGWRCSSATGYLKPARKRPNLRVETDAHATQLVSMAGARPACATCRTAERTKSARRAK